MPSGRRCRNFIIKWLLPMLVVTQGCGQRRRTIASVQGTTIDFDMALELYLDLLERSYQESDRYLPITGDYEAHVMTKGTTISADDGVVVEDLKITTVANSISYGDAAVLTTVKGAAIRINAKITIKTDCRTGNHRIEIHFPALASLRETSICPRLLIGEQGWPYKDGRWIEFRGEALFPDGARHRPAHDRIEFEGDTATFPSFTIAYLHIETKTRAKTLWNRFWNGLRYPRTEFLKK
jgi:hypothetical protein